MSMAADKLLLLVDGAGAASTVGPLTSTYVGANPTAGFHQAATQDGTSFWLAGSAAEFWGFRYVGSRGATTSILAQGSSSSLAGYDEARGVTVYGGAVYGSSYSPTQPVAAIYSLGAANATPTLDAATRLPGFSGLPSSLSPWGFVFESASVLWVARDQAPARATLARYEYTAPAGWGQSRVVTLSTTSTYPALSLAGRREVEAGASSCCTPWRATRCTACCRRRAT